MIKTDAETSSVYDEMKKEKYERKILAIKRFINWIEEFPKDVGNIIYECIKALAITITCFIILLLCILVVKLFLVIIF